MTPTTLAPAGRSVYNYPVSQEMVLGRIDNWRTSRAHQDSGFFRGEHESEFDSSSFRELRWSALKGTPVPIAGRPSQRSSQSLLGRKGCGFQPPQLEPLMASSSDAFARQSAPLPETLKAVRPCAKCGTAERYKDGKCKVCSRASVAACTAKDPAKKKAQSAAWYAANSERIRALHAEWKAANPEKAVAYREAAIEAKGGKAAYSAWCSNNASHKASAKLWLEKNRDKRKASRDAWAAANPELRRLSNQNRRARKKAAGGTLSRDLAAKLFQLQKGKCPCCKQPLGDDYHLDHIKPLVLGGTNTDDNIQLLRALCNMQKHSKHPIAFMQERGFLL